MGFGAATSWNPACRGSVCPLCAPPVVALCARVLKLKGAIEWHFYFVICKSVVGYVLNCVSLKDIVEVLSPRACECDLD